VPLTKVCTYLADAVNSSFIENNEEFLGTGMAVMYIQYTTVLTELLHPAIIRYLTTKLADVQMLCKQDCFQPEESEPGVP